MVIKKQALKLMVKYYIWILKWESIQNLSQEYVVIKKIIELLIKVKSLY